MCVFSTAPQLLFFLVVSSSSVLDAAFLVQFGTNEDFADPVKWENNYIEYRIDDSLAPAEIRVVSNALALIERMTCIRFIAAPKWATSQMILFLRNNRAKCSSRVGKQMQAHFSNVIEGGPRCFKKVGRVLHEIMHSFGFLHEHQRPDREHYIRIRWNNILKYKWKQFAALSRGVTYMNSNYDMDSVMHYPSYKFAAQKGLRTIEVINNPDFDESRLGQRERLSAGDIAALNRLFCDPDYKDYY